jgi:hypothetical protein
MTAYAEDSLFTAIPETPKALTVRQPWASLITAGLKDVENRSKPVRYRGTILIHAGLTTERGPMAEHGHLLGQYPCGVIIGAVDIVGCVRDSGSEWAMDGYWHWLLANPRQCGPVPAKGALTFWPPAPAVTAQVLATLR